MKRLITNLILIACTTALWARTIDGVVVDKTTKEPLIGVAIMVQGTSQGTTTDFDGKFTINAADNASLEFSYLSYKSYLHQTRADGFLNIEMESDDVMLEETVVLGRKVLTSVVALNNERMNSGVAVENMGTKEMGVKGLSNVKEGVEKLTAISFNSGQLFVRGLGDRYSSTTLNGLPIASPNPDNKIIPLELFPNSIVENISVQKVFQASSFADYSGAHINIDTRENVGSNFLKVSLATGGQFGSVLNNYYKSDTHSMLVSHAVSSEVIDMNTAEFTDYTRNNELFKTSFAVRSMTALPDASLSLSAGRTWDMNGDELNVILAANMSNGYKTALGSYTSTLNNQGAVLSEFDYDSYTQELKSTAMLGVGYDFAMNQKLNYSLFYTRNAIDNYKLRHGVDEEGNQLLGSNNTFHAYSLLNQQLLGAHPLSDAWHINWGLSYSMTQSDEPDRKQVMYEEDANGQLSLFKLNAQETMRYFGKIAEDEVVANVKTSYSFQEENELRFGLTYKNKLRDYNSARFYYNLDNLGDVAIDSPFDTNGYLNNANVANGTVGIIKDSQPRYNYYAGASLAAGFAEVDYHFLDKCLLNLGLRYEYASQWVQYWNDASMEQLRVLSKGDLFPALNFKYAMASKKALRLALSRTVTRPSFVEMAPFYYKASYGSATIRGNENLQNGYNYNADLRYEKFSENGKDLFSVTAYFKLLDSPIEKIQQLRGSSVEHSFRNINQGMATGIELELKKEIIDELIFGLNGSYMHTNVNLGDEVAIYTDKNRALQGASPYLLNADISYQPKFKNDSQLSLTMLYSFEGPRIEAVGILGMSNVIEKSDHKLNFVANYNINERWNLNFQLNNILNTQQVFTQEVEGKDIVVERYYDGISFQIGASLNL